MTGLCEQIVFLEVALPDLMRTVNEGDKYKVLKESWKTLRKERGIIQPCTCRLTLVRPLVQAPEMEYQIITSMTSMHQNAFESLGITLKGMHSTITSGSYPRLQRCWYKYVVSLSAQTDHAHALIVCTN